MGGWGVGVRVGFRWIRGRALLWCEVGGGDEGDASEAKCMELGAGVLRGIESGQEQIAGFTSGCSRVNIVDQLG